MSNGEKTYTRREEFLNAVTHYAGAAAVIAGIFFLFSKPRATDSPVAWAASLFYAASLLFMFTVSGFYHSVCEVRLRKIARQLDHSAIYFLITGTYAPLLYLVSPDRVGVVIFSILAVLSVTGTAGRFFNIAGFRKIEIALYIIMGWCCVAIAGKLISNLPPLSLWLLLAGGISYTAGVAVYLTRREFFHAIWHLFVLCGAGLQFFAVTAAMDL